MTIKKYHIFISAYNFTVTTPKNRRLLVSPKSHTPDFSRRCRAEAIAGGESGASGALPGDERPRVQAPPAPAAAAAPAPAVGATAAAAAADRPAPEAAAGGGPPAGARGGEAGAGAGGAPVAAPASAPAGAGAAEAARPAQGRPARAAQHHRCPAAGGRRPPRVRPGARAAATPALPRVRAQAPGQAVSRGG